MHGNFYCKKIAIKEGKSHTEIISCSPHEHAHTLNIYGSWLNVTSPFVLCIHVGKYACVRVCNNVSYALDYTEKSLYKCVSNKTKYFLRFQSFFIFCIYMSTLHDMVEQKILVVKVGYGNRSTSIQFVLGQRSVWRYCEHAQARLSLGCLVVRFSTNVHSIDVIVYLWLL